MLWRDFEPYVMPFVIGCPLPVMEHHVRQAAIEFFRETKAWRTRLDHELTNGTTHVVDLSAPTGSTILDIEDVEVDGAGWPIVTADIGDKKIRQATAEHFCFSRDLMEMEVYPLQAADCDVTPTVSLIPSEESTGMPDAFKQYARHIAIGAISTIKALPGQDFTAADAPMYEERFKSRIRTESARLARSTVAQGGARINPSFI